MNPDRVCGMCRMAELKQKPIDDLLLEIDGVVSPERAYEILHELTGGCPACMLAAVRQQKETLPLIDVKNRQGSQCWSFKDASEQWMVDYGKCQEDYDY